MRRFAGFACVAALAAGCHSATSAGGPLSATCQPTTESIQQTIFAPKCAGAGCHGTVAPSLSLDLVSPGVVERLAGAMANGCGNEVLVVPGAPDQSYLIEKLALDPPTCGERMPQGSLPLSAEDMTCLRDWIAALPPIDPDAGTIPPEAGAPDASLSTCPTGQALCGGSCIDVQADNLNCGACGTICGGGTVCTSGACTCAQSSQVACGGKCVVPATDSSNCGACGTACAGGSSCVAGRCTCPGTMSLCGGVCVDSGSDAANCGGCGKGCATGQTCNGGACACPAGLSLCGSACVDLKSDASNCGGCAKACRRGQVCANGVCGTGCPTGTTNCSGSCVDTSTSLANCGTCGTTCAAGQSCVAGSCGCPTGTKLCGSSCVNTATDSSNCGSCGNVCSAGTACNGGACGCGTGTTACGTICVNLQTDPSNCGTCGRACASGSSCSAGSCGCASGQTLCGSTCTNLATDAANCGACGKVCASGQTCVSGACSCGGAMVSFASQVQPIFNANCTSAGCHAGTRPAQSLGLETGKSYAELVSVASTECGTRLLVKPNAPTSSYLLDKLYGTNLCMGSQMPKSGTSIPAAQIDTIRAWICQGAPNN